MKIEGKVHCFFEQSGTFKNEFIKLGIPAEDYDIQNNFGETDHVIDLFGEIDRAYTNITSQAKPGQARPSQAKPGQARPRQSLTKSTLVKTLSSRFIRVFTSAQLRKWHFL